MIASLHSVVIAWLVAGVIPHLVSAVVVHLVATTVPILVSGMIPRLIGAVIAHLVAGLIPAVVSARLVRSVLALATRTSHTGVLLPTTRAIGSCCMGGTLVAMTSAPGPAISMRSALSAVTSTARPA